MKKVFIFKFYFIIILLLVSNCSVEHNLHEKEYVNITSAHFSLDSISKYNLGIFVFLIDSVNSLNANANLSYTKLLEKQLSKKIKKIKLIPTETIIKELGNKNYQNYVLSYENNKILKVNDFNSLADKLKLVRFIIFVHLNYHGVKRYQIKNNDKSITLCSERSLRSFFSIYDIYNKKLVLNAYLNAYIKNELPYNNDLNIKYPPIPTFKAVLIGLLDKFTTILLTLPKDVNKNLLKNIDNKVNSNVPK
ncbi:MAG: hypothetical protein OEV44_05205 [Spirochaetota bacterium]|nr:hypothetical protein [Spirochaetota bacterium]